MGGAPEDGKVAPLEREQLRRAIGYFAPYKVQWLIIFVCIALNAGLGILPPLVVRAILDKAIPLKDLPLLWWLAYLYPLVTINDVVRSVMAARGCPRRSHPWCVSMTSRRNVRGRSTP